jgi:hypothetical protein
MVDVVAEMKGYGVWSLNGVLKIYRRVSCMILEVKRD